MHFRIKQLLLAVFFSVILAPSFVLSQELFYRNDSVKVYEFGEELLNPWAGGLNATQFYAMDIDFDGMKDLIAFDKGSYKLRCFINTGSSGLSRYKHAPQFEHLFPAIQEWCVFTDYNADGKEDLFSYYQDASTAGVRVYRNTSGAGGPLQFSLAYSVLETDYNPGGTPNILELYCSPVALPAITDMDGDGDTDVLSFIVFGTTVEYHKNKAVELGYPPDSLKFEMVDDCWGDFAENSCSSSLNFCPQFMKWKELTGASDNLHAGSCMLCMDTDGDNDKDLILGDISCDSLEYFHNGGSAANAHIDSVTKSFPPSKPVKLAYFPCAFYIDTDNDSKRDLLVCPNNSVSAHNFKSVWRYKNTGSDNSPVFIYEEANFLQDSMLDFGDEAYPAIVDENGDGLFDIIVGNFGYYATPAYQSRLAVLRNVGSATAPAFSLVTRDYATLSSNNYQGIAPAFGDLDNDGDPDMVAGHYNGQLSYFQNIGGAGNPLNLVLISANWMNIDAYDHAMPQIIDVNRDGKNDLLVGSRNGKIHYFQNIGTAASPSFSSTATSLFFGGVNVCKPGYITGYAAPHLRDVKGSYELLVGSERGYLYRFGNIDGNLGGSFTLIDSVSWNIWEGSRIAPYVSDLNGDGMADMILGNSDGGINFFQGDTLLSSVEEKTKAEQFIVFPNPATSVVTLQFENKNYSSREISIYDFSGKLVYSVQTVSPVLTIGVSDFPAGIYLIRMRSKDSNSFSKLIIPDN